MLSDIGVATMERSPPAIIVQCGKDKRCRAGILLLSNDDFHLVISQYMNKLLRYHSAKQKSGRKKSSRHTDHQSFDHHLLFGILSEASAKRRILLF